MSNPHKQKFLKFDGGPWDGEEYSLMVDTLPSLSVIPFVDKDREPIGEYRYEVKALGSVTVGYYAWVDNGWEVAVGEVKGGIVF